MFCIKIVVLVVLAISIVKYAHKSIGAIKNREKGDIKSKVEILQLLAYIFLYTSAVAEILTDHILAIILSIAAIVLFVISIVLDKKNFRRWEDSM